MNRRTRGTFRHHSRFDLIARTCGTRGDRAVARIERTGGVNPDLVGARGVRAWSCMLWRARVAAVLAMSLALLAATHASTSPAAHDPAAAWRVLLTAAGCPPTMAHDLAVRIERMAGAPPGPHEDVAVTAAQRAEQITHLVVGRHGLQLTSAQLDAALAALIGPPDPSHQTDGARGDSSKADAEAPPAPAQAEPTQPFTTRQAHALLREWLPTPGPR